LFVLPFESNSQNKNSPLLAQTLTTHVGKTNFVLERASIDELFVDITNHCYDKGRLASSAKFDSPKGNAHFDGEEKSYATCEEGQKLSTCCMERSVNQSSLQSWRNDTTICHEEESQISQYVNEDDDDVILALQHGCFVAKLIRQSVFDSLGFTLSVGISTSKLVSKLAASYGKPNGQGLILPTAIGKVMEETKIKKVRNFGGKIGKKIQTLLPPGEETMGSIARFLSLADLSAALGREMGQMVFDACRGEDGELVKETVGALTKSITAFKSFGPLSFPALEKWVVLLATDIVARVELDTKRNERYPKNCNIQYVYLSECDDRITRSIRVPFPPRVTPKSSFLSETKQKLVNRVRVALESKAHFPIHRLGLSAVDFEARPKCSIDSFFKVSSGTSPVPKDTVSSNHVVSAHSLTGSQCNTYSDSRNKTMMKMCNPKVHFDGIVSREKYEIQTNESRSFNKSGLTTGNLMESDHGDLAYAQRLQALYDRENNLALFVPSTLSKNAKKHENKRRRIDSFFLKKDKPR